MELAESAPKAGIRDETTPALADQGGTDELRRIVRQKAEQDLFHELIHQYWRLALWRWRGHAARRWPRIRSVQRRGFGQQGSVGANVLFYRKGRDDGNMSVTDLTERDRIQGLCRNSNPERLYWQCDWNTSLTDKVH